MLGGGAELQKERRMRLSLKKGGEPVGSFLFVLPNSPRSIKVMVDFDHNKVFLGRVRAVRAGLGAGAAPRRWKENSCTLVFYSPPSTNRNCPPAHVFFV
jgi:hypothetical protein